MPRTTHERSRRFLFRLLFFSLAGWVLVALGREPRKPANAAPTTPARTYGPARAGEWTPWAEVGAKAQLERWEDGRRSPVPGRAALATVFVALFFAGAALTAGAGDKAAMILTDTPAAETASADDPAEETQPAATDEATEAAPADEAAPAEPAPEEAAPAPQPEPADAAPAPAEAAPDETASPADDEPMSGGAGATTEASAAADEPAAANGPDADVARVHKAPQRVGRTKHARAAAKTAAPVYQAPKPKGKVEREASRRLDPEATSPTSASVVWIKRDLPDPTPPARRLASTFAERLTQTARRAGVDWALMLGILRAEGLSGAVPADRVALRRLAAQLAAVKEGRDDWHAVLALAGRTTLADQAVALARYNRAVGLQALVQGLESQKQRLTDNLLHDLRVDIYPGGRNDLLEGRIDVRVVVLVEYLAEAYGQVTVSCLFSGHRLYARPGVVSAHIYGHAVDISALDGVSVIGHQEPGGLMEDAVRQILLLPSELQPRQVISLLGLGGPSFPLANHDDHLHVGY